MRRWALVVVAGGGVAFAVACFPSFDHLDDGIDDASVVKPDTEGPKDDASTDTSAADGADTGPRLPISCKDASDRGLRTTHGEVTIDPDGDGPLKPFKVYCRDIATTPTAYLTLVATTNPNDSKAFIEGSNISGWAMGPGGGATSCLCPPDVVRAFTRVRLMIGATIRIDLTDTFFSTTNRINDQPNACEQAKPSSCMGLAPAGSRFGVGGCCIEGAGALGRGNIDLRGTAFHIDPMEAGHTEGFAATGTTTYKDDPTTKVPRKLAEMQGGGSCGFQLPGKLGSELALEQDL